MSDNETTEVQAPSKAPSKLQRFIKNHYTSIIFTSGVITAAAVCMIVCKFEREAAEAVEAGEAARTALAGIVEAADQLANN